MRRKRERGSVLTTSYGLYNIEKVLCRPLLIPLVSASFRIRTYLAHEGRLGFRESRWSPTKTLPAFSQLDILTPFLSHAERTDAVYDAFLLLPRRHRSTSDSTKRMFQKLKRMTLSPTDVLESRQLSSLCCHATSEALDVGVKEVLRLYGMA